MFSTDIVPWVASHRRRKGDWPSFADYQNLFQNVLFLREADFNMILASMKKEAANAKSVLH